MKTRFISEVKKHLFILGAGAFYLIWLAVTDIYIPCIFREMTGLKCPGCGISHMFMALFRLDFKEAFLCNPFLFIALPLIGVMYIGDRIYYIKNGVFRKRGMARRVSEYIILAATVVFWIVRNID